MSAQNLGSTPTGTPTDEQDAENGIMYTSDQVMQNLHEKYTETIQRLIQGNAVVQAALDNAMVELSELRVKCAALEGLLSGEPDGAPPT